MSFQKAAILVVVASAAAVAMAQAGPGPIEYAGGAMGKVTFTHSTHATGMACTDCHTAYFQMAKGTMKLTQADHQPGKACFNCHKDGGKAFSNTQCTNCHKK